MKKYEPNILQANKQKKADKKAELAKKLRQNLKRRKKPKDGAKNSNC